MSFQEKLSVVEGVQTAWDATSIELAQVCPRKYYYSIVEGIAPADKSVHLVFGGLYATALEHFYKHRADGDDIDTALRKVVHEALIESWDSEAGLPVAFEHAAKTRVNLIRTIVWYVDQFADETEAGISTYHLADGKPAVELSFSLEVHENLILCGHLDRVVEYGGSLYVMDQKTTGSTIGPYFFSQFSPSNQMSLYAWAGQAILHSPIRGVIIDGAQIAVNFTRFERGITTRTKAQLEEWFASGYETIHRTQDYTRHFNETESITSFPMNTASCGNYGGCPFRILCARDPSVRPNFIKSDFVPHNWDPLQRR